ncbi:Tho complex subunit 7 protein [Acanthamoeba castellanii str. Neff]|uniref:Tho complex subunit 7 protein n=1 Tax=Acanthamoeba castellanii (strain ATCC 30010 / Neff) TaxID=1257118 RepID=L8GXH2_ACACF|nr:Tho complex subunit 7 protein [Acanthamoeba castellanii str. Neff]ELR17627.1 Tho complex subunit 7 protein [Acanthamoeba castellanii str. Neff]
MGDRSKIREPSKELEDTAAIRNRLVVVNDRRVTTLTAKFFAFIRAAESDTTTLDEVELVEGQIQKEFDLFDISLDKLRATADANGRELQQYHSLHLQREGQIARAKEELVRLKTELEHEKRRRNHKEEYEAIAKIINQYPSRADTQRQLQALEDDLASLADAKQQIEDATQKRRKQFALLFDCIDDLQRALRAEGEEAKEDESRKESVATGKRKRPATEATDDTLKGKALADEPPAVSSSAETARKRVREVEMEEARDDETEPGEITTKGLPSCCLFLLSA